ncbi:MAG: RHS repeat-associated core domain-containing protein, partial [Clostridia bacterium]
RYAGYQYDEETEIYYLNARYYDPKIARFLTEDTYRGEANDPLSLNLYTYSHNEPVMYGDPTGHRREDIIGGDKSKNKVKEALYKAQLKVKAAANKVEKTTKKYVSVRVQGLENVLQKNVSALKTLDKAAKYLNDLIGNTANAAIEYTYQETRYQTTKVLNLLPEENNEISSVLRTIKKEYDTKGNQALVDYKKGTQELKNITKNIGNGIKNDFANVTDIKKSREFSYSSNLTVDQAEEYIGSLINVGSIMYSIYSASALSKPSSGTTIADTAKNSVDELANTTNNAIAGVSDVTKGTSSIVNNTARRADFYVTPSGDAIPSTGYRYFARNPNVLQSAKNGVLPGKSSGTYFSFDKIDDAIVAQGKLQIPYRPEYRASFDTLKIIDDIKVPNGNWGRADYLEPITKDFLQFGPGKATQAVTTKPVDILDLFKLR